MSVETRKPGLSQGVWLVWSLLAGGVVMAEKTEGPEMEFIEYLGSWEGEDEDWVLFSGEADEKSSAEEAEVEPEPQEEKVAELENEQ